MVKHCSKCKKIIGIFSNTFPIENQFYCRKCANDISDEKALEKTLGWYSQEDIYYSGLIVENGVKTNLVFRPLATKKELENNSIKIKNLPSDIKLKILEVPQFKIFFENDIPYYITQKDSTIKKLPIHHNPHYSFYYDPVKDTEAYKMVKKDVVEIAQKKFEEHMLKHFGTEDVTGAIHIYYAIEAMILYDKYGIHCINNPMSLNHGLFID